MELKIPFLLPITILCKIDNVFYMLSCWRVSINFMEPIDNVNRAQIAALQNHDDAFTPEINAQPRTAKPIKESPAEINQLISSLPTIIIGLSKDNEIVHWNAKAENVFNKAAADVIGLSLSQCGIEWDWDKIAAGISQSRMEGCPTRVDDVAFRRANNEERYLGLTIQTSNGNDDSSLGLTIIAADITDRKKLETQLQHSQKMEAIGQLAAGIAHEINTPTQFVGDNTRFFRDAFDDLLHVIKGYERLLEAAKSNSITNDIIQQVEERVEEIDLPYLEEEIPIAVEHTLKGLDRISNIVQAMKIFAHPGMIKKEPTDINKEIEKTITITRNEWKYVAELITDFDTALPLVPCFRAEFNQVILNMIVNAAHAVAEVSKVDPSKKGTICIRTCHKGNLAKIYISDTGVGIPDEIRHKIFDLFFTTKEAGKGSGQGLAISHSVIVDKHNGRLDLKTQEGKGTTFIIELPMTEDPFKHG